MPGPETLGTLRVDVGKGPLRTEHQRLIRTALRRGKKDPEGALEKGELEGEYPEPILNIARNTWCARMVHEHHSAAVFSRLLPQLMEAEASLDLKTCVLRMSMDELRHASLCAGVVRALGGVPEIETDLKTHPLPEHEDASPKERALRNVMFVGCMSETISIALLTEEKELTTEPMIKRVVDQLAADEVLHAKLGWSYLSEVWPALNREARERMNAYLPIAFGYLERKMLSAMPRGPKLDDDAQEQLEALGCMSSREGRELMYETIKEVIVPRLSEFGLNSRAAWRERVRDD